jgi:hypothetical protein
MPTPSPSNLDLPACLNPQVAELWEVYEESKITGPGRGWRVACKLCGKERIISTAYLNANTFKCRCYSTTRNRNELTYEGRTEGLTYWSEHLGVNLVSMRARYHSRKRGENSFTDAEVMFGPRRASDLGLSESVVQSAVINQTLRVLQIETSKAVAMIMKQLSPLIYQSSYVAGSTHETLPYRPTGHDFPIDALGMTLGEVVAETGLEAAASALRSEYYDSFEEKQAKLSVFIPLLDTNDPNGLTLGEQMQLLAPNIE